MLALKYIYYYIEYSVYFRIKTINLTINKFANLFKFFEIVLFDPIKNNNEK